MRRAAFTAAALACAASAALAPTLELTTGSVAFGSLGAGAEVRLKRTGLVSPAPGPDEPAEGPWLVSVAPHALGAFHASADAAMLGCGQVENFLHPSAFTVHVRARPGACLAALRAVAGVEGLALAHPELRTDLHVMGGTAFPNPPLRLLSLTLPRNASFAAAAADLAPLLAQHCPACQVIDPLGGTDLFVSSMEGAACFDVCALDAPAECGCVIPEALVRAAAAHSSVLWLARAEQAYTANAFGRGMMETSDIANSGPSIIREYGQCTDTSCNHAGDLPFSQMPLDFPGGFGGAEAPHELRRSTDPAAARAAVGRLAGSSHIYNHTALLSSIHEYALAAGLAEDLGTCTTSCSGLACGLGFGLCADLLTPTFQADFTGASQVIQVVDTGLDYGLPFFFDGTAGTTAAAPGFPVGFGNDAAGALPAGCSGTVNAPVCPVNPPPASNAAHRKVNYYWGYADAIDNVNGRGHGTHVAGSVAGDAAGVLPVALRSAVDLPVLSAMKGSASAARIIVADAGCSTVGGCARPGIQPPRGGGCGNNALCIPADLPLLFEGARAMGARVSCNSWGGGANSQYTATSVALDNYIANRGAEDLLLVFAAANSGNRGYYTISGQAVAKNVLAVAALADGFLGHRTKTLGMQGSAPPTTAIPPLYQALDGRSCGAILLSAAAQGAASLAPTANNCPPFPPSPAQCWAMANDGQTALAPTPGGFPAASQYGGPLQAELAMCCGCTLAAVAAGCQLAGNPCAGAGGSARLATLLAGFVSTYNGRWPAVFSSQGPAWDGRIKADVGSTGFEIMSARSASNFRYNSGRPDGTGYACPPTSVASNAAAFTQFTFTVPASELFATVTIAPTLEPIRLNRIFVPISENVNPPPSTANPTGAGWLELWIVSTTENAPNQATPVRVAIPSCGGASPACPLIPAWAVTPALPATTTGFVIDLVLPPPAKASANITTWGGWEMGSSWAGSLQFFAAPGQTITDSTAPGASATCFTPAMGNEIVVALDIQRGGALGYISAMSGTSMSAPAVAGIAALVRSFYTDGYAGLAPGTAAGPGAATPAAGFLPSAALVKATLINSVTPIVDSDYYAFFGLPQLLRWQAQAQSGHGVPNLVRGLSFATLGTTAPVTRAGGQLPTLLVPGLGRAPGAPPGAGAYCGAGCEPALATGQLHHYCVYPRGTFPAGISLPISATLAWTDPPGAPSSLVNLVNDLDLIHTAPSGLVVYGNAFLGSAVASVGGSLANGTATGTVPDTMNNVERLKIPTPPGAAPGANPWGLAPWVFSVRGTAVNMGTTQRYSLVVTGPGLVLQDGGVGAAPACGANPP